MRNRPGVKTIRFWVPIVLFVLAFGFMAINNVVRADTLTVHLNSTHVGSSTNGEYNESNFGAGYGWNVYDNTRFVAGGFLNSSYLDTWYGGLEYYKRPNSHILTEYGVNLVAVSGYKTPVAVAAYIRLVDVFKVSVNPWVVDSELKGAVFAIGFTFGD